MIAVDTNVLVHAHRSDSPFHGEARRTMTSLAEGVAAWAVPWPCLHEFLAIVTHPRIWAPPTPLDRALDQVDAWLESPSLVTLSEPAGYWLEARALIGAARVTGARVHDARIAALCQSHGVRELLTADRDFGRFPSLRCSNPLVD